jgi:hypothetical protein
MFECIFCGPQWTGTIVMLHPTVLPENLVALVNVELGGQALLAFSGRAPPYINDVP